MKGIFSEYVDNQFFLQLEKYKYEKNISLPFYKCFEIAAKNIIFENSLKTLIYLLHEEKGKLVGNNKFSRYSYFNTQILSEEYQSYVMKRFPILKNKIDQMIADQFKYLKEVERNLFEDIDCLKKKFKIEGKCIEVCILNSDRHQNGKNVLCITFQRGKVIYKPRSLSTDVVWNKFIKWQNLKNEKVQLQEIVSVDCFTYGWQEYISSVTNTTEEKLEMLYKRMGVLLCMAYICGLTDIHMENIVINENMPYIIDLETLFNFSEHIHEGEICQWICESVFSTQMLPALYATRLKSFYPDISGITGGTSEIVLKKQTLKDLYTDEMKVVYKEKKLEKMKNVPQINGKYIEPRNYMKEIIEGFEIEYDLILKFKLEIIQFFETNIIKSFRKRIIFRDTNKYKMLLLALQNPKYLTCNKNSEMLFETLKRDKMMHPSIIEKEIENLKRGDIPYFVVDSENNILNNEEKILKENFSMNINKKISKCSKKDMMQQIFLIRLSLHLPLQSQINNYFYEQKSSTFQLNKEIDKIADRIMQDAFIDSKHNIIEWFNVINAYPNWAVGEQDLDLYSGLTGNAIFFAALYRITKERKNLQHLQLIINTIERRSQYLKGNDFSLFTGKASLVYLYAFLAKILGTEYFKSLEKVCDEILEDIEIEKLEDDMISGISGILLGFSCAYKILKKRKYYQFIKKLADILTYRIPTYIKSKKLDNGVAHGYAGIILALSRAYIITKEEVYTESIVLLEKSIHLVANISDISWCHGAVGLGLVYIELEKTYKKGCYNKKILLCESALRHKVWETSDCLCHGNMGTIDFYVEYSKYKNDKTFLESAKELLVEHWSNKKNWYCGCKQDVVVYGLMVGMSGMGYELLRVLYPDILPDIMLVEI